MSAVCKCTYCKRSVFLIVSYYIFLFSYKILFLAMFISLSFCNYRLSFRLELDMFNDICCLFIIVEVYYCVKDFTEYRRLKLI